MYQDTIKQKSDLRWRIVVVLLLVSLLPLVIAGFGSWIVFGRLLEQKALEQMRTLVSSHADAIENTLSNRIHLLQLLAETHSVKAISDPEQLHDFLDDLNLSSEGGFIDLGIIDADGNHLAYIGPYSLLDKNYSGADWFKEVMTKDVYVSDVFLGFRQVPHCVIAVKSTRSGKPWILRATVNSQQFDKLVKTGVSDKISDIYIVNENGIYQTTPNAGTLLEQSSILSASEYHSGVKDRRKIANATTRLIVTSWLNNNRWMLVVEQDLDTVLEPVHRAIVNIAQVVAIAVILLVVTTIFATRHLSHQIDKANAEREEISRAFVRSAKLASVGELATGLAHEINNPLAIISAEQTNISDIISEIETDSKIRDQITDSVKRCKVQIQRCASITRKMLQFGRKQEARLEPTEIAPRTQEIINLLDRHAKVRNIQIVSEIEDNLPQVIVDPIELEQLLVNLINNAIDAMPSGGRIVIKIYREDKQVHFEVKDNGNGIPSDIIDRIFEPFFTTKPVGKGTGLGLSVCYGIVNSWGGKIYAESTQGKGTNMHILMPLQP